MPPLPSAVCLSNMSRELPFQAQCCPKSFLDARCSLNQFAVFWALCNEALTYPDFTPHRLVTLAVQNAMLTLIMHYSRISAAPSATYSAAAAVLATELLKGTVSLLIAFIRIDSYAPQYLPNGSASISWSSVFHPRFMLGRFRRLGREVFRADCWKLSIPAILYGPYNLHYLQCPRLNVPQSSKIISSSLQFQTSMLPPSRSAIK